MKIRKTFLEQMEIIQMNPSKDSKQPLLPFKKETDETEYSVRGTPEIAAIYKQLKQISDDPKKVEQLRQLSYQRGVDRKAFDEIKRQVEDEQQPFLNKKMKEMRVANLNQLRDDIDKINEQFKKLKKDLTLKNLYKQSLRNILNKFFMIPGMKTPRRYLMLPMSYSNTLKDINDLNSAENKYEKMFKILKDQIVIEPEKIDSDIKKYLEQYDYQFKDFQTDFYNNICYTKNGAEIRITDELEKIKALIPNISNKYKALEKAPTDKKNLIQKEIKKLEDFKIDYLNRVLSFNMEVGTGMGDQSVVVITWVPRLILTQSTGTPWTSCQHLITGSQNPSVMTGMQEGVFIAWLVGLKNVNDIRKPKARMLIKPFFPKVKGTKKEIIWWSSKIYSESGGNFTLFKKVVNSFLYQKQQKTVEKGGGISKDFALMSKKKNAYRVDNKNLYRIYPDDEQGYNPETESFEKMLKMKKPKVALLFNAHDFEPKAYIDFLKKMSDNDFIKHNADNSVLTHSMENNAATVFNYVAERLKKMKFEKINNSLMVFIEPETNQTLVKMYINLLNEFYRIYEDIFIEKMPFGLIYKLLKDHQMVNVLLKEPLGEALIKKGENNTLILISANPLVSNDIKKNINAILKNKIEIGNREEIIGLYSDFVLHRNEEMFSLSGSKLKKAFDEVDDSTVDDLDNLMTRFHDLGLHFGVENDLFARYSKTFLEIIKHLLSKKPNIIATINKRDKDIMDSIVNIFVEKNDLDLIKEACSVKALTPSFQKEIKRRIEELAHDAQDSFNDLISKIKTLEDMEFFAKFSKQILIVVFFFLSEDFSLPLHDLTDDADFNRNLALVDIFLKYVEKDSSAMLFLKKHVLFDETVVQTHLNRKHFSDITNLVKNINNPTMRRFVMFIIGFLKEEQRMEILANITLFFTKGEDSPMLWYVDKISKLIKEPKKVKTLIKNFSFGNFTVEIARDLSFSDTIELDHLPSLLAQAIGVADINFNLFIKTFDLTMADFIEIVANEINFGDSDDIVYKNQKCMHTLFQYEEFRKVLENRKITYQNNFKDTVMNLVNQKKYITDEIIKTYDYFDFYVKTKNNIKQFRAMLADFDPDMNPIAVYNLMAIFFKNIKIKDIIYDAELKNIFSFLKRKEAEKVLKDLDVSYEKKDIDNIFA